MLELLLCWIFLTLVGVLFIVLIFISRMIFGIPISWKRPILVAEKRSESNNTSPKKENQTSRYIPLNETKEPSSGNGYYDDDLGWRFRNGNNSRGSQGKG